MDRKLISRRIGSILDDISRLSNALYAMDTTDIQRYPDNYEILSTDAALRAERIACRLRHLIYSSTSIQKGEYLQSASVAQGISITPESLSVMVVVRLSLSRHPRQVVRSPCGSASTRSTFLPSRASPTPKLTVVVVLPVPPF